VGDPIEWAELESQGAKCPMPILEELRDLAATLTSHAGHVRAIKVRKRSVAAAQLATLAVKLQGRAELIGHLLTRFDT
jgi:hypothetical protein